jgi:TPP-dependent pyruvate/acetoin dehydrogenase alpha subunit
MPELYRKADAYNVAASAVDGMDVLAVETAAREAADYVRHSGRPYFLECNTYRFRAHSMFDAEAYRSKAEIETWRKRDPITTLTELMKEEGTLDDETLTNIEREVAAEINEAVAFAEAGTWEPTTDLERFVYSERRVS